MDKNVCLPPPIWKLNTWKLLCFYKTSLILLPKILKQIRQNSSDLEVFSLLLSHLEMSICLNKKESIYSSAFCYIKINDSNILDDIKMGKFLLSHIFKLRKLTFRVRNKQL